VLKGLDLQNTLNKVGLGGWPVTAEKGRTASVEWCRNLRVSRYIVVVYLLPWKSRRRVAL
jgi:hypothetical protein